MHARPARRAWLVKRVSAYVQMYRDAGAAHARMCRRAGADVVHARVCVCVCVCVCACGCGYARGYLDAEGVGGALRQYAGALALALLLLRDRSLVGSAKSRSAAQPGEPKEALSSDGA